MVKIVKYNITNKFGRFGNEIITILKLIARVIKDYEETRDVMLYIQISTDTFKNFYHTIIIDPFDINPGTTSTEIHKTIDIQAIRIFYWPDDIGRNRVMNVFENHFMHIFNTPNIRTNLHPYDEQTLVVHSRAGDTIAHGKFNSSVHHSYVIYPISLVIFILCKFGYTKLVIVAEDPTFSWVTTLKERAHDINIETTIQHDRDNMVDWFHLGKSQHLLLNFSTFTLTSTFFNHDLKRLYVVPAYLPFPMRRENIPFEIVNLEIKKYIQPNRWRYDRNTHNMIINHPIDKINILTSFVSTRTDTWR